MFKYYTCKVFYAGALNIAIVDVTRNPNEVVAIERETKLDFNESKPATNPNSITNLFCFLNPKLIKAKN